MSKTAQGHDNQGQCDQAIGRFLLREVRKVAKDFGDVEVQELIVDAVAALLISTPDRFDVIVTTNMSGDILPDEASELSGGLDLSGSMNVGEPSVSHRRSMGRP